ncbi:MAG: hypothetical protein EXR91_01575 [Gemmatimonadetes bacterium]|nr:hypothetical protein [Gemmatimonadota bacterium]
MEQLIFFGVIILFSILESVARSRQKKRGPQAPEAPAEWQWEPGKAEVPDRPGYDAEPTFDREPSVEERPTFDAEPTFDDVVATRQPRPTDDLEPTRRAQRAPATSSESMIPADLWEEIAGLGRGRVPVPAETAPTPPPARQPQTRPLPTRASRPTPPHEAHTVHQSHVGFGTDPSERARSEQDGLDPLARRLGADAAAVHQQLRTRGRHALRQAMILNEVLGPPVATRPDRYQE